MDVTENKLVGRMFDMPGFEHASVLCPGFASFPLESMGKKIDKYTVFDWTPENPEVQREGALRADLEGD